MNSKATTTKQVLVLHKTLDILETLRKDGPSMGLADVARSVAMPKATVYRILRTLEIRGYLDRRSDGSYRMSEKLFAMQSDVSPTHKLLQVAPPIMEEFVKECRETVNLGTLDGGEVVVIATIESPQSVRMVSKVGNRRCVHTTALGKMFLSSMTDEAVKRLLQLKGLPRLTPNSLTTQAAMMEEIRRVRKDNFAVDNQENEMEGRCIAMNIPNMEHVPVALSVSSPVFRMDMRRLKSLVPKLRATCARIEAAANNYRASQPPSTTKVVPLT